MPPGSFHIDLLFRISEENLFVLIFNLKWSFVKVLCFLILNDEQNNLFLFC